MARKSSKANKTSSKVQQAQGTETAVALYTISESLKNTVRDATDISDAMQKRVLKQAGFLARTADTVQAQWDRAQMKAKRDKAKTDKAKELKARKADQLKKLKARIEKMQARVDQMEEK